MEGLVGKIIEPCLRFNCLVKRSTMCLSEHPCGGHSSASMARSTMLGMVLWWWIRGHKATPKRSDGFSTTLFSLAQRGLSDEMFSTAHSTLHQCASFCFGVQKSAPKPEKPWTSQQTAAMIVWRGTARHQLRKHTVYAKQRENASCKKVRRHAHRSRCGSRGQPRSGRSRVTSRHGWRISCPKQVTRRQEATWVVYLPSPKN